MFCIVLCVLFVWCFLFCCFGLVCLVLIWLVLFVWFGGFVLVFCLVAFESVLCFVLFFVFCLGDLVWCV